MVEIGRYNRLRVKRITAAGAWLATDAGEILLPPGQVPAELQPGDWANVFIYLDSEDRMAATTRAPKATVGEFAVLEVADVGSFGAFLDWGLDKELLVPFGEQPVPMKKGERYLVGIYVDNSGRIAASAKIGKFLETDDSALKVGEEVDLMIYAFTRLGAKVVINGRYEGLLFGNELYGKTELGATFKGYIKKIRPDHKIDVTMRKGGYAGIEGLKERVLKTLAATGGYLPLGDGSPAGEIGEVLNMSKKTFKKVVGSLYKEGFIELTRDGIKLSSK